MSETQRKTFTLERVFKASPEKVWGMWTTREGLERWWGPEGFHSVVQHLDVRVGGRFEIVMTAVVPEIVAHLKAAGVPASTVARGDYTDVETQRRLGYTNAVDFVPGLAPYRTTTVVEMSPAPGGGTHLVVTNDAMHDPMWTENARLGWGQQIGKLASALG
ncbi:MAG TPA: SRPBCC domain-containing protein [Myxococcaceae bacterium]|jgi:uncharacterized protein YndB with AHSA1/START domain|nr:SRPBCC domain-containing protein [Myxococcaceae bacterium]